MILQASKIDVRGLLGGVWGGVGVEGLLLLLCWERAVYKYFSYWFVIRLIPLLRSVLSLILFYNGTTVLLLVVRRIPTNGAFITNSWAKRNQFEMIAMNIR